MNLNIYRNKKPMIAGESEYLKDIIGEINSDDIRVLIGNERLIKTIGNIDYTKSEYDGWRIIYRINNQIAGAVQGVIMPDDTHVLSNIYVKPEYRKQGIGQKLVELAKHEYENLKLSDDFTNMGAKFFKVQQESKMSFKQYYLTEVLNTPEEHEFVKPNGNWKGYKIVLVNTEKFDACYSKDKDFYVGPNGTGAALRNRYENFKDYWLNNKVIEVPNAFIGLQYGTDIERCSFTNGRHRYAYMRDIGMEYIPMMLDNKSIKYANEHGFLK